MEIQFTFGERYLGDGASRRAACAAFGISEEHMAQAYRLNKELTIRCTDAQFGQFIAHRVNNGCRSNGIIDLNIKIIPDPRPQPCPPPVFQTQFDVRSYHHC